MGVISELQKNFREAKAELKGEGISKAVRIRPLTEVQSVTVRRPGEAAKPTNMRLRMPDGTPMVYFTDGSLRHMTGFKPGKAARKALKRAKRNQK